MRHRGVDTYYTDGIAGLMRTPRQISNAPQINPGDIGDAVAAAANKLGQNVLYENQQDYKLAKNRQYEESALNVQKNLNTLANQNRLNSAKFLEESEKQKSEWLKEIPEDRLDDYKLMFDTYQQRFSQVITNNEQQQIREGQKATFLTAAQKYYDQATRFARLGDREQMEENLRGFERNRQSLFSGGFISGEKFVAMGQNMVDETDQQRYLNEFDAVKLQGQTAVNEYIGNFLGRDDIAPERRQKFATAMRAEYLNYQAQNAVKLQNLHENASVVIEALNQGLDPQLDSAEILSGLKAAGDIETAKKLNMAMDINAEMKDFVQLTPADMLAGIELQKNNLSTPKDINKLKAMQTQLQAAYTGLKSDPVNFALSHRIIPEEAFNISDPEVVNRRLENAQMLQKKYNLPALTVLTKAEADGLSNIISSNDSKNNTILLGTISKSAGKYAPDVIKQIAPKNPSFAHAASIFEKAPGEALDIIEGIDIVKYQKEYTPSEKNDFDSYFWKVTGESLAAVKPETAAGIKDTVFAKLAKLNRDNGLTDRSVDYASVKKAIQQTIGNIVEIDQDGIGWNDNYKVPAPFGVNVDEFEDWYESFDDNDIAEALTIDGWHPRPEDIRRYGKLSYYGEGEYRIIYKDEPLLLPDGLPFVLKYRAPK